MANVSTHFPRIHSEVLIGHARAVVARDDLRRREWYSRPPCRGGKLPVAKLLSEGVIAESFRRRLILQAVETAHDQNPSSGSR